MTFKKTISRQIVQNTETKWRIHHTEYIGYNRKGCVICLQILPKENKKNITFPLFLQALELRSQKE